MSVPLKCMTVHHHPLKVMNQPYRLSAQKGHPIPSFAKLISRAIPLDGHQPPQRHIGKLERDNTTRES